MKKITLFTVIVLSIAVLLQLSVFAQQQTQPEKPKQLQNVKPVVPNEKSVQEKKEDIQKEQEKAIKEATNTMKETGKEQIIKGDTLKNVKEKSFSKSFKKIHKSKKLPKESKTPEVPKNP